MGPNDLVAEPENKLIYLTTISFVGALEREHFKRRGDRMSLSFLGVDLPHETVTIPFKNFSPFYEEFKEIIQKFLNFGFRLIGQHKAENFKHFHFFHLGIDDDVPALILKMDDLVIGFLVCSAPLTLSFLSFFCEVLKPRIKALATFVRDFITFLYFIQNVVKIRM